MTFTEISELAGQRRLQLCSLPLYEAMNEILLLENKAKVEDDFVEILQKLSSQSGGVEYFSEATIAKKKNPEEIAKARLLNGFSMNGISISLNQPPEWESIKSQSRNFRYKMHSWVFLDVLLRADEVSESDEFLMNALKISEDWVERFVIEGDSDEFAWYDMAVGQRATKLPYLISRMIEIDYKLETILKFLIAAELHMLELSQEERIATHSNHGLFQIAGLLAISKNLAWLRNAQASTINGISILNKMLEEHFTKDGLHKEHSPEYHLFMINHLSSLVDSGWIEENSEIAELTDKVRKAAMWMQSPDGKIIAMGDSKNNLPIGERWHDAPEFPDGLMFFETGGLVIHNSQKESTQLVFSSQFHSRQHKHADDNNVLYYANGNQILVDSGTYTYQYDLPERIYCESTRAHNTVEINSNNFSRFKKDAYGSGIKFVRKVGPCTICSAEVQHNRLISSFLPNNKIRTTDAIDTKILHTRTLIDYPSRFLAIIDKLKSDSFFDITQWNHFHQDLRLQSDSGNNFLVLDINGDVVAKVLNASVSETPMRPVLVKGQTQPHLQGWVSEDGRTLVENFALGYSHSGNELCFVTVIDTNVGGNTGQPYLRYGSNGKYLRFALTQNGEKVDFKFRTTDSQELEISADIGGLSEILNIRFGDEGD